MSGCVVVLSGDDSPHGVGILPVPVLIVRNFKEKWCEYLDDNDDVIV